MSEKKNEKIMLFFYFLVNFKPTMSCGNEKGMVSSASHKVGSYKQKFTTNSIKISICSIPIG